MFGMPTVDKQKMKYSNFVGETTDYERDENGDIIYYTDSEGNSYPLEIGTTTAHYDKVVDFEASICGTLNTLHAREYGVDQSAIFSELQCLKGQLPFEFGTKVWKESEVKYNADGTPDESSADYTVTGMLKEYLHFDFYLLQRVSK